jgi:hypothetical protein
MKDGQKLKLGDAHVTPINIQEVQASKLGDAQGTPFFINKNIRSSFKYYIFIASYAIVILGASVVFGFCFFSVVYYWIPSCLFWRETRLVFIA